MENGKSQKYGFVKFNTIEIFSHMPKFVRRAASASVSMMDVAYTCDPTDKLRQVNCSFAFLIIGVPDAEKNPQGRGKLNVFRR